MSTILRNGVSLSAIAAIAIARNLLCTLDADGKLTVCTAALDPLGVSKDDYDAAAVAGIDLPMSGIQELTAADAIDAYAKVYPTAGGKITSVAVDGCKPYGIALQASGANNDVIPVLPCALLTLTVTEIPNPTYVAAAGGATVDANARAAQVQLAADVAAMRAVFIASGVGVAE